MKVGVYKVVASGDGLICFFFFSVWYFGSVFLLSYI